MRDAHGNILAWITLLVSNPDWSLEDNRAKVLISVVSTNVDKNTYNKMFDGQATGSAAVDHGQLDVSNYAQ